MPNKRKEEEESVSNADLLKHMASLQEDFKRIASENSENYKTLVSKIDGYGDRLDKLEDKFNNIARDNRQKCEEIEARCTDVENKASANFNSLDERFKQLEDRLHTLQTVEIPEQVRQLKQENEQLKEEVENRTNRQLRRTLVFKNIPERKDDESYFEVKALLAETISQHTDISQQEVFAGIERSHRERKRENGTREGKRKIFAAFLNWELPQKILDQFKKRCIEDRTFDLYVDQMYGARTTARRNLAFLKRKQLKENGTIPGGFVAFPARLMVPTGQINGKGKKIYRLQEDFSLHKIEKKDPVR